MPIITTTSYCVYFCTKSKGTIWSCGYLYVVILWFYWSGPWDPMWRYVAPELKWVGLPWIIGNISLNFDIKFPQFVQKNQMKSNEQCFQITTLIAITLHSCPAIHFRNLFLTNIHFYTENRGMIFCFHQIWVWPSGLQTFYQVSTFKLKKLNLFLNWYSFVWFYRDTFTFQTLK